MATISRHYTKQPTPVLTVSEPTDHWSRLPRITSNVI